MLTMLAVLMTILFVAAPTWLLFDCARPHRLPKDHKETVRKTAA